MPESRLTSKINNLFQQEEWEEARILLERQREKSPRDHWILTQLGVTFYEQQQYEDALRVFLPSLEIVPDCPLTLWNLAGTFDSLGEHRKGLAIYTWLLNKKPTNDPCWEDKEWSDSLKADCVYRVALCFQHLGKKRDAKHCYNQYLELLAIGLGSYSIDDVQRQIRSMYGERKTSAIESAVRKSVNAKLQLAKLGSSGGLRNRPAVSDIRAFFPGHRVASNK